MSRLARASEPQKTSTRIERYDAEQTDWARRFLGLPPDVTLQAADFAAAGVKPYSVTGEEDCNAVVGSGWAALLGGIAGTTVTNKLSATYGRIGVGTGTTVPAWADTWLGGDTGSASVTSYYQLCGTAPGDRHHDRACHADALPPFRRDRRAISLE